MPSLPPVYTKLLFAYLWFTGSSQTFGPVPAGKVWIVTDIDVSVEAEISNDFGSFTFADIFGRSIYRLVTPMIFPGKTFTWRGREVFVAGEEGTVATTNFVASARINGYELSAP